MSLARSFAMPALLALSLLLVPEVLYGQGPVDRSRTSTTHHQFIRPQWLPPQAPTEKDPAVAGVLSLLFPFGVGSFYAENPGHGQRHFFIAVASMVGALAAFGSSNIFDEVAVVDPDGGFRKETIGCDAGCTVGTIFALTFGVNWLWGAATAVADARQFNDLRARVGLRLLSPRDGRIGVGARVRF